MPKDFFFFCPPVLFLSSFKKNTSFLTFSQYGLSFEWTYEQNKANLLNKFPGT